MVKNDFSAFPLASFIVGFVVIRSAYQAHGLLRRARPLSIPLAESHSPQKNLNLHVSSFSGSILGVTQAFRPVLELQIFLRVFSF